MKESPGTCCRPSTTLKTFSRRLGRVLGTYYSPSEYRKLDAKVENKLVEAKRGGLGRHNFKSFNTIVMKFPLFREELWKLGGLFEQYDEANVGTIDRDGLKKCLHKLQLHLTEKDMDHLFHYCDMGGGTERLNFSEFVALLCLGYLLVEPSTSPNSTSKTSSPELEAAFETIVSAFLFLDKNGDGKLHKKDMVKALNETSLMEKSPAHITRTRFKEMDKARNGKVNFREFVFTFINWVGIDTDDEIPVTDS